MTNTDTSTTDVNLPQLFGREGSHYTRVARIFAHEAGLLPGKDFVFMPIADLGNLDPSAYGGHPALKLPSLLTDEGVLTGTLNICRAFARDGARRLRVVWPEDGQGLLLANAHELVAHTMQTAVQLAFGTQVARLDGENIYFRKARIGLHGALGWIDGWLSAILAALPPRDLSFLEVSLFCAWEHLRFRNTLSLEGYPEIAAYAEKFGARASAIATPYRFVPPI